MDRCFNKSPRTLSESVYEFINANGINNAPFKGARRPFDHYRPTESAWYIIPSAELPFFRFGKFYFEWENPQKINCGIAKQRKDQQLERGGDVHDGMRENIPQRRGRQANAQNEHTKRCGQVTDRRDRAL